MSDLNGAREAASRLLELTEMVCALLGEPFSVLEPANNITPAEVVTAGEIGVQELTHLDRELAFCTAAIEAVSNRITAANAFPVKVFCDTDGHQYEWLPNAHQAAIHYAEQLLQTIYMSAVEDESGYHADYAETLTPAQIPPHYRQVAEALSLMPRPDWDDLRTAILVESARAAVAAAVPDELVDLRPRREPTLVQVQPAVQKPPRQEESSARAQLSLQPADSVRNLLPVGQNSPRADTGMKAIKTVLELDLVGYGRIARTLEENMDSAAVAALNDQIQHFVDAGLHATGLSRDTTVMVTTGDGAILVFDRADYAHQFAAATYAATMTHNAARTEVSAKRRFRVGAATGEITMKPRPGGGFSIAGITIGNAVRLEAAGRPGELVIDMETFNALPSVLQALYQGEEEVPGKHGEKFRVRRFVFDPDCAAEGSPHSLPARG